MDTQAPGIHAWCDGVEGNGLCFACLIQLHSLLLAVLHGVSPAPTMRPSGAGLRGVHCETGTTNCLDQRLSTLPAYDSVAAGDALAAATFESIGGGA